MWGTIGQRTAFGELWPLWYGPPEARDRRLAAAKLRTLADQGYAPAQFGLGLAYFDGDGVRRDYVRSFQFCLTSAEQGYPSAENMVGNYYVMAKPAHNACALSSADSLRWQRRAADHGNVAGQYNLALAYWTGHGVDRNPVEAYVWASLSVHCSRIKNRMGEVLCDMAAAELDAAQKAAADRRLSDLKRDLPHPWSEHLDYWRLLAECTGAIPPGESA